MLDSQSTSERLRDALELAFDRWHARAPETNTKAALARQVGQLAGRPCTPQAVSGWFKTGRMDKVWITHVEQVLGYPLGFGGAEAFYANEALRGLMSRGVVPKFVSLATNPDVFQRLPGPQAPDFVVDLGKGQLFIEVKTAPMSAEDAKKQAAAYSKALSAEYRIIGGPHHPVFEQAATLADELLARNDAPQAAPSLEQMTLGGLDWLPAEERALLLAYRDLSVPELQHEMVRPILEKAAEMRRYREFFQHHTGTKEVVPDHALEHLRAPAHEPPAPKTHRHRGTKIDESKLPEHKPKPKRHTA